MKEWARAGCVNLHKGWGLPGKRSGHFAELFAIRRAACVSSVQNQERATSNRRKSVNPKDLN